MNIRSDLGWEKYLKPFLYKRLPDGTGWSAVLGTMCALTFMLLVVTGMILAFYYVPSPDKAWDSVQYISNEVPLGNIVRGLHHWSAGLMVLLVFCHLMVTYMHGSYAAPRQITWLTGVCLFLVTLGLGFTGYLLPWDMKAYWATVVGANIPNQYPGVGNYITRFILGGNDISGFTLTRFYSVHTLILPACLLMLMAVHIYLIRVHNLSDPRERLAGECLPPPSGQPYRFYPEHTNRTTLAFGCIFVGLLLLASYAPPHMEARAGTFIPDYLPRPEWYYMWLFQRYSHRSRHRSSVILKLLPAADLLYRLVGNYRQPDPLRRRTLPPLRRALLQRKQAERHGQQAGFGLHRLHLRNQHRLPDRHGLCRCRSLQEVPYRTRQAYERRSQTRHVPLCRTRMLLLPQHSWTGRTQDRA